MLDLNRIMDDYVEANKRIHAHSIVTVEDNLNKELDGFQSEIDQNLDILQESISKLAQQPDQEEENLEEESQEEESLTETVLVEQVQLQPQEELKEESLEAPEALQDASVTFWPWTKGKEITALLTEKSSGHEGTQEPIIQPKQCRDITSLMSRNHHDMVATSSQCRDIRTPMSQHSTKTLGLSSRCRDITTSMLQHRS